MNVLANFTNNIIKDSDAPSSEEPAIKMGQKEPNIEDTQEILEDPQIAGIFNDLRSEFPTPTDIPAPTPSVTIEGFEDIPLSTAVRVNKHLKQQFIKNFKF